MTVSHCDFPFICTSSLFFFFLTFIIFPGVQILDRTTVQQVLVEKGQVTAVETDRGAIECEYFVNCAGQVRTGILGCHWERQQ